MNSAVSLHRSIRARPLLFDACVAAGVAVSALVPVAFGALGRGLSAHDAIGAAVTFVLLLARHRVPLPTLSIALLCAVASIVAAPTNTHVLETTALIALYTVTAQVRPQSAIATAVATACVLYAATAYADGEAMSGISFGVVAFTGMAAAIGISVRSWRGYVAAAEDRAERAEATREQEARRRVAEERLHIARELHDVIAHHIALINVQAGVASHLVRSNPDKAEIALGHIGEAGRTVLDELGSMLYLLRQPGTASPPTEPLPGLARLGHLLESVTAAGLAIQQRTTGQPRPLPAATDLAAYRIIQEGLTNAHKHGRAYSAQLLLDYRPQALEITIRNPVYGRPAAAVGTGNGLIGLRERAQAAGGSVSAATQPGGTYRLHARLPLPGSQETAPGTAVAEGNLP